MAKRLPAVPDGFVRVTVPRLGDGSWDDPQRPDLPIGVTDFQVVTYTDVQFVIDVPISGPQFGEAWTPPSEIAQYDVAPETSDAPGSPGTDE